MNSKTSSLFSDFFKINIGHVAICAVFLFGLGLAWARVDAGLTALQVQRDRDRDAVDTRIEIVLKRVSDLEGSTRETEKVLRAIDGMQTELRYYGKQFDELKADVRAQRK